MAKTSVYLPDDLAEQARARGIPISEVAQAAVRQAVKEAQLKEDVMTDLQAVAERLRETQRQDREKSQKKDLWVHRKGVEWARTRATATDLEYVATFQVTGGDVDDYRMPTSLVALLVHDGTWGGVPSGPGKDRWDHFQAGAREVWEAVKPLLIEINEDGGTAAAGSGGYSETVNPEYRLWVSRSPALDAPLDEHDRWAADEPPEFL